MVVCEAPFTLYSSSWEMNALSILRKICEYRVLFAGFLLKTFNKRIHLGSRQQTDVTSHWGELKAAL